MDNREIALAADMASSEGGGGGGTTDYTDLSNKPSINGNQLVGDKSTKQLGIKEPWVGTAAQYAQEAATIPAGTPIIITDDQDMDTVPTSGSSNPVTSDGIYRELAKLKVINENPENHNGIYRGKDLTNIYTIEQIYERVHDGSFEDLYLGDYFTVHLTTDLYTRFTGSTFESGVTYYEMGGTVIARTWTETQDAEPQEGKVYATKQVLEGNVDYMIGGFDLYIEVGTAPSDVVTDHHIILLPRSHSIFDGTFYPPMHSDQTELTGYAGSDMHKITLPCFAASTYAALNGHMLQRTAKLSSQVDASIASMAGAGYVGATKKVSNERIYMSLMNECQLFGTMILSSSWYEAGVDFNKFPVFNYINPVETEESLTTNAFWLRTVMAVVNNSVEMFVKCLSGGSVGAGNAESNGNVRPFFLFG